MITINANEYLAEQTSYEDCYRHYMKLFEEVAFTSVHVQVLVQSCPVSWGPLLCALGAKVQFRDAPAFGIEFGMSESCRYFCGVGLSYLSARTQLEALCSLRPETADALWKCDVQWKTERTSRGLFKTTEREFIVTNNGSFHRNEIQEFMSSLKDYVPTKPNVVLVPCAADKPYPSPLHKAVLDLLPDDSWDIMNATGVLGLVPRDLWPIMPYYDSGVPNEWRLMNIAGWYFSKHRAHYKRIVCFTDYYSLSLQRAFDLIGLNYPEVVWPNTPKFHYDYVDLMSDDNMQRLKAALAPVPTSSVTLSGLAAFVEPVSFILPAEQR